jgi:hypothetical protein
MAKPQSRAVKTSFNIKGALINNFGAIGKRLVVKTTVSLNFLNIRFCRRLQRDK